MFLIEKARKQFSAVANEPSPIDNSDGGGGGGGVSTASITPLSDIAEAFEKLASVIEPSEKSDIQLSDFCEACSHVSVLFGCLGIAFKFAELEYVAKVRVPLLSFQRNNNSHILSMLLFMEYLVVTVQLKVRFERKKEYVL